MQIYYVSVPGNNSQPFYMGRHEVVHWGFVLKRGTNARSFVRGVVFM